MQSSKNSPATIEARVSPELLKQLSEKVEAKIRAFQYDPSMSGEDALKTLATAAGMRDVVNLLAMTYQQQQKEKAIVGSQGKRQDGRWPSAGTPSRGTHSGAERSASRATPPSSRPGA